MPDKDYAEEDLVLSDEIISLKEKNFEDNINIKRVYLGKGITIIPRKCFNGCTNLEEVYLAGEKITINEKAFYGCSSLNTINLETVITIGKYAFYGCVGLKDLTLPKTLEKMADDSFNACNFDTLTMPCVEIVCEDSGIFPTLYAKTLTLSGGSIEANLHTWLNVLFSGETFPQKVYIENCDFNYNLVFKNNKSKIYIDEASYKTLDSDDRALFDENKSGNYIKQWAQNNA